MSDAGQTPWEQRLGASMACLTLASQGVTTGLAGLLLTARALDVPWLVLPARAALGLAAASLAADLLVSHMWGSRVSARIGPGWSLAALTGILLGVATPTAWLAPAALLVVGLSLVALRCDLAAELVQSDHELRVVAGFPWPRTRRVRLQEATALTLHRHPLLDEEYSWPHPEVEWVDREWQPAYGLTDDVTRVLFDPVRFEDGWDLGATLGPFLGALREPLTTRCLAVLDAEGNLRFGPLELTPTELSVPEDMLGEVPLGEPWWRRPWRALPLPRLPRGRGARRRIPVEETSRSAYDEGVLYLGEAEDLHVLAEGIPNAVFLPDVLAALRERRT